MIPRVMVISEENIVVVLVDRGSSRAAYAQHGQEHFGHFKNGTVVVLPETPPQHKYAAEGLYRRYAPSFFGVVQP